MWLCGIPGAGKSVLAAAAISEALQRNDENNAVAYFYCDYKDAETQNPTRILGSLAEQVARQSERCFEQFNQFMIEHFYNNRLQTFTFSCDSLCQLIIDMSGFFQNLTIAVDGLDECGDNVRTVVGYLVNLTTQSATIRSFLSSRDLIDIKDFLGDYERIPIAAQNVDLRLYVAAEIEKRTQKTSRKRLYLTDPDLKGEIMDKLIDGSEGMFRWAAVQLDYICEQGSDADIRSALQSLPPDLFSSYERLLVNTNSKPPAARLIVQQTLKWISFDGRIKTKALSEALSVKPGMERLNRTAMVREERILQLCGSLIRRSVGEDCLEFAHFSVQEFLKSLGQAQKPDTAFYGLQAKVDWKNLAVTAFTYLCCEDFANPCSPPNMLEVDSWCDRRDLYSQHPFRQVARKFILPRKNEDFEDPEIFNLLKRFFSPSRQKARLFCLQELLLEVTEWLPTGRAEELSQESLDKIKFISPLHHAAMMRLPTICDWLLKSQAGSYIRSPVGTPLLCALAGSHRTTMYLARSLKRAKLEEFQDNIERTQATVELLISCMPNVSKVIDKSAVWFTLVFFGTQGFEIARSLVNAGALLCEGCLDMIEERLMDRSADTELIRLVGDIKPANLAPGLETRLTKLSLLATSTTKEGSDSALQKVMRARNNPEFVEAMVAKAIAYEDLTTLSSLLDNKVIDIEWRNGRGANMLHLAAQENSLKILKILLDREVLLNARSVHGATPLHCAAAFASPEVFLLLVSRSADLNAVDDRGYGILHTVARYGNHQVLRLFQNAAKDSRAFLSELYDCGGLFQTL